MIIMLNVKYKPKKQTYVKNKLFLGKNQKNIHMKI